MIHFKFIERGGVMSCTAILRTRIANLDVFFGISQESIFDGIFVQCIGTSVPSLIIML